MNTIMRYLTGVALVAAALGTGRPQNAYLSLNEIWVQQPQETIAASRPCQRARESPQGLAHKTNIIDPKTYVQDLKTLMDISDEAMLAGRVGERTVLSPSGESTATYYEVKVIRSWKGSHHAGDILTFGMPLGWVSCEPTGNFDGATFLSEPEGNLRGVSSPGPYVFVLFLRHPKGKETQSIQGLRPAAGQGIQGIFEVAVPGPSREEPMTDCAGGQVWSVQRCDSYMETSQSPVMVPYAHDPLAKKYGGMPASDFLREVQSAAAAPIATGP